MVMGMGRVVEEGSEVHLLYADTNAGPGNRIDAVRLPAEEGREGRGERERGEDYIYQERGRELRRGRAQLYIKYILDRRVVGSRRQEIFY